MARVLQPPPTKKPDNSDELARLFDDGTELPKSINSLSPPDSQPRDGSQPKSGSLSEKSVAASQSDSQPKSGSLSSRDTLSVNLLASLPETKGHLRLPNAVLDHLLRLLDTDEQAIYIQLFRLSWGYGKPTCKISLPTLAERTNIKQTSLKAAIKRLEARGLIEKQHIELGFRKEQGITYRVSSPDSQPPRDRQAQSDRQPESDTIKENTLKETHNTESVSVGSHFGLGECRRYAESLRNDGITNPGGYATKIHRSGEADELIALFLAPAEAVSNVDLSKCPDCHGTGFWEPGGAGKGVAKCKHERLLQDQMKGMV